LVCAANSLRWFDKSKPTGTVPRPQAFLSCELLGGCPFGPTEKSDT
jgi:hypothetical protein